MARDTESSIPNMKSLN